MEYSLQCFKRVNKHFNPWFLIYNFKLSDLIFIKGHIWGNIISSTILKPEVVENSTFVPNIAYCGVNDCPGSEQSVEINKPEKSTVLIRLWLFFLIGIWKSLFIFVCFQIIKNYNIDIEPLRFILL